MKKILLSMFALLTMGASALAQDKIFSEDFSDETYNVTWGGTSAGGISPEVVDGVLIVANGSQSGDRGAYISFGENAYEGSAHLTFDMGMTKSGWSGKNNTFYVYPSEEKNRYPSRTDALVTITQESNGAISVNGTALGTYSGTMLTYDLYLDADNGVVKLVVKNGDTEINTFNVATSATGIGALHLTFNKNYGAFSIDNISLSKYTPDTAPTHSYTINAVCGTEVIKELATGICQEGNPYKIEKLSYGITFNGKCYLLDDSSVANYSKSFTMGKTDVTETVTYTESNDVAYFFEAESILSKSYGNSNGAYSGGTTAGVNSGATLTMPNIAAGAYTITVNSSVRRSNEDILKVQTSTDGETWKDAGVITLTSNVGGDYSANVILPADGSIRLVEGKAQNMFHYIDYIILEKAASISAEMTITDAKYATFCAPFDVAIPTGVTASKVSGVAESEITLEEVSGTIPANTPVVLYAESEISTTVTGVKVAGTPTAGLLTGVYEETTVPTSSYVLQNQDGNVAFYLVNSNSEIKVPANRAYLTVANGAKVINFPAATAIKAIEALTSGAKIYDINGREINKLQKGINIVNGVKVMVK